MHLVFYGYTAWRNGGRNGDRITSRAAPVDGRWVSAAVPGYFTRISALPTRWNRWERQHLPPSCRGRAQIYWNRARYN